MLAALVYRSASKTPPGAAVEIDDCKSFPGVENRPHRDGAFFFIRISN